ncbi:glutaredoxin 3 [Vandammella animalimorsus]|uniref:Glutaredoxin n=1 Tax=Vandammella animalimorsus TaxID=2029117 RepID=A0A2A2ALR0_9BURK|nr:glutaredoxin 3 [Vandammella animalimorsus]PAT39510.1 glutaredoxin 3 [Vandammella animalimorsus]RMX07469.1 glutaredoxin 3 [Vandammella animalimorsus]
MQTVTMYTTAVCPYCLRAKQLLKARGVQAIEEIRVDLDPGLRTQMMERTGRRTVPQIYIGDTHVGGYDDLAALDAQGQLAPLLG